MATIRKKAVYLPSNIDYLTRNNGHSSSTEMLGKMDASDWVHPCPVCINQHWLQMVIGVGFYLACTFLVL